MKFKEFYQLITETLRQQDTTQQSVTITIQNLIKKNGSRCRPASIRS